jgi:hypothetical protein
MWIFRNHLLLEINSQNYRAVLIQSSVLYGVLHSVLPTNPVLNCVIFVGDKQAFIHTSKHCLLKFVVGVCETLPLTLGDAHASTKNILQSSVS